MRWTLLQPAEGVGGPRRGRPSSSRRPHHTAPWARSSRPMTKPRLRVGPRESAPLLATCRRIARGRRGCEHDGGGRGSGWRRTRDRPTRHPDAARLSAYLRETNGSSCRNPFANPARFAWRRRESGEAENRTPTHGPVRSCFSVSPGDLGGRRRSIRTRTVAVGARGQGRRAGADASVRPWPGVERNRGRRARRDEPPEPPRDRFADRPPHTGIEPLADRVADRVERPPLPRRERGRASWSLLQPTNGRPARGDVPGGSGVTGVDGPRRIAASVGTHPIAAGSPRCRIGCERVPELCRASAVVRLPHGAPRP